MTIYDILPKPIAWAFMAFVKSFYFVVLYGRWIIGIVLIVFLAIYLKRKDKKKEEPK